MQPSCRSCMGAKEDAASGRHMVMWIVGASAVRLGDATPWTVPCTAHDGKAYNYFVTSTPITVDICAMSCTRQSASTSAGFSTRASPKIYDSYTSLSSRCHNQ
jgi:hypothetical protein